MMKVSEKQLIAASQKLREKEYWLDVFAGDVEKKGIPYDRPPLEEIVEKRSSVEFRLESGVCGRLLHMSNQSDEALHMILLTGLVLLLHRYSGSGDITIGTPVYRQAEGAQLINTVLPLRVTFASSQSFKQLLLGIRQLLSAALDHADYPVGVLARQLGLETGDGLCPLFDVGLLLPDIHAAEYLEPAPHPLTFLFRRAGDSVNGELMYRGVYDDATIERVFRQFEFYLGEALAALDTPFCQLTTIPPDEWREIVGGGNRTANPFPVEATLQQLFASVVKDRPGHIAILHGDETVSYRDLDERSDALAFRLREMGVGRDSIVAILAERSPIVVCAMLGVLKAGGAYLPIDPAIPGDRVRYMLRDSATSILLVEPHLEGKAPAGVITLDVTDSTLFSGQTGAVNHINQPGDLAYVIYTSGSTGRPKGVLLEHRGVVNYIHWASSIYTAGESCVFPLYTSISFDLTVTSVFVPLLTGNTIAVYPQHEGEIAIQRVMADDMAHVVKMTPAHLKLIEQARYTPSNLRRMILGGENLETSTARAVYRQMDQKVEIYNEYGPTETVVGCMIHRFDPALDTGSSVSIGGPIQNTSIYILNDNLDPVPAGAVGELFIAGEGVGRGYLNRPELTGETFLPNPLAGAREPAGYRNSIMYRTGDLARRRNDGNIEFLGRVDHQVKIRGYRIECGDIEAQLRAHPEVADVVVLPLAGNGGDLDLCAYVVQEGELSVDEWRSYLAPLLPDYMIPAFFVNLDKIPLTANGKVDRRALPQPRPEGDDVPFVAPRDHLESQLISLWAEVLGMDEGRIGIDHNFFALGGQSLKGARLVSMILERLGIDIPLVELFRRRTIRRLAEFAENASTGSRHVELKNVPPRDDYPLSSGQQRLFSLQQLDPQGTAYNMPVAVWLEGQPERERLVSALRGLVKRHESLRTYFVMQGDRPVQKILPIDEAELQFEETDNRSFPQSFIRPFQLDRAPLMRVRLDRHGDSRYLLMMDVHHIVFDGVSQGILVRDFIALYRKEVLPPLEFTYKDWACWQNSSEGQGHLKRQEEFWLRQFDSEPRPLSIPSDFPRPRVLDFAGRNIRFDVGPDRTSALRELALREGTTLYTLLLAIINILFHKLSGQEDIVVGAGVAGRNHPDLEGIVGMFVNTLPLRNFPAAGKPFRQFLEEVATQALSAFQNQDYKLEDLVRQVVPHRDRSRNPLFDTVFVFNNFDPQPVQLPGLVISPYSFEVAIAKFDLSFYCNEAGDGLAFSLEYRTSLFKEETVRQFARYIDDIIAAVLENHDVMIGEIAVSHRLLEAQVAATSEDFTAFDF